MTRRRIVGVGLLSVVLVLVAGAAAGWWLFLRDDAPPKARLVDRKVVEAPTDALDGRWTVQPGKDVFAGYRITEDFGVIHNTAVARTGAVKAHITIKGTRVTQVTATVNMASLKSQDDQLPVANRDKAMRTTGLQTDTFPTATFTATKPIELHKLPKPGTTLAFEAVGNLKLHGVSRTVTIPITARSNGEVIDLTGSLEVRLADYDIDPPAANIVTVAHTGTLELQLTFTRET